jgi:hypothetical protein
MPPMPELPKDPRAYHKKLTLKKVPLKTWAAVVIRKREFHRIVVVLSLLIEYAKIIKNEDPAKVGEIKIKDPILGDCRKKMRVEFKKLEDPPKSDEDLI